MMLKGKLGNLNLSLGNSCLEKLLKITNSKTAPSFSIIAAIHDHIPPSIDPYDGCTFDL